MRRLGIFGQNLLKEVSNIQLVHLADTKKDMGVEVASSYHFAHCVFVYTYGFGSLFVRNVVLFQKSFKL